MYIVIDLMGDEETLVVDDSPKKEDVHEQLVKWEDLVPEPTLQVILI